MRSLLCTQRLLIALAFAAVVAPSLHAQEDVLYPFENQSSHPWRLGVELGANYSLFSRSLAFSPFDNPTSPNHVLGSGSELGGFIDLAASFDLAQRLRLYARAGMEFVKIVSSGDAIIDFPRSGNFFDTTEIDYSHRISTFFYTGELGVQYDFFKRDEGLYGALGLVYHGWSASATMTDRTELPADDTIRFANGTQVSEVTGSDTTSFEPNRFGLHAGLGWQFPVSKSLIIAPELSFHYMFGPPFPDGGTFVDQFRTNTLGDLEVTSSNPKLHYLRLGITLWWRL